MKIAVDVCVGKRGAALLRAAGHDVIEAEHGESDRAWFTRAIAAGAELFVSADADIEIYAYDFDVPFFQAQQHDSGIVTAQRILTQIDAPLTS
jgi:hypothetical protein